MANVMLEILQMIFTNDFKNNFKFRIAVNEY